MSDCKVCFFKCYLYQIHVKKWKDAYVLKRNVNTVTIEHKHLRYRSETDSHIT